MLKYVDTAVTFAEFPNEIALCINISNCPFNCQNCHSSYLHKDIGEPLTTKTIKQLIGDNEGITCIGFMGGDADPKEVNNLAHWIRKNYPLLHIGWYSGREIFPDNEINIDNFDWVKIGAYMEQFGPLNNPNTNQRFYKIDRENQTMIWCTNLFWKEAE